MPKTKLPDRGKPTPGPWRIIGFIASQGFTGFPIYNGSEPNTGRNIVDVLYTPTTYREDEANARLVAAAPEMLEALESMIDCFRDAKQSGASFTDEEETAYITALEIIAKAKGEK